MVELERVERRGWEVLRLTSEQLVVEVVPALGGTLVSLRRRADDAELLATTPWGLPHRTGLTVPGAAEAEALDTSAGGISTLFPNAGQSVNAHGTEWGFDGEARVTWLDWSFTGSSLVMTGRLRRSPFELTKILSLREHEVTLGETVKNVGAESVETIWASQLLLGGALLGPDSAFDAAASVVRPDPRHSGNTSYDDLLPFPRAYADDAIVNLHAVPGPDAAVTRQAYLSDFSRPWLRVSRPSTSLGLEVEWDLGTWPHLTYALEAGGRAGYPWYGSGYRLGLTPSSSWPTHGLHDARRVSGTTLWIRAGTALTSHLTLRVDPLP